MVKEVVIEIIKYSFVSIGIYSCTNFLVNFLKNYKENKINNCDILLENTSVENLQENELKSIVNIKDKLEILEKKMEYIDIVNNRLTNLQIILGDLREKISYRN